MVIPETPQKGYFYWQISKTVPIDVDKRGDGDKSLEK